MPTAPERAEPSRNLDGAFLRLVESSPDGIVISRDAIILYANPAAVQLLGYESGAALVGQSMAAFLDQAALTTMRLRLQK